MFQLVLEEQGYRVLTVSNGKDGLDTAIAHLSNAVLPDWHMSELDGEELCRRVRQHSVLASMPIAVISARDQPVKKQATVDPSPAQPGRCGDADTYGSATAHRTVAEDVCQALPEQPSGIPMKTCPLQMLALTESGAPESHISAALDKWVTAGAAPAKLVAASYTGTTASETRPPSPYPQVAKYIGGDIESAASFQCSAP